MKKLLIFICMILAPAVWADTMPYYIDNIPKSAIGVFQAGEKLSIYANPDEKSYITKNFDFSYNPENMPDGVFCVLSNKKKLGLMYVTDVGDDNWVEVIYDKHTGAKGWVMTEDNFQFLPWLNFYNMYGKKYGLRLLKNAPDEIKTLHSKADDMSQNIGKINHPKQIKLITIQGNWVLVSVLDLDKVLKIGYIKWRGSDGSIWAFPNIK